MQVHISSLPNLSDPITQALFSLFKAGEVLFVGGCVRDAVLGKSSDDIDLATSLLPQEVISVAEKAGIKAIPTGIKFGTVTLVISGRPFQLTTLRKDKTTDGRWATVAYGASWREDAARRDFTFNALYMDPTGIITDYFGGIEDLKEGFVRFIGKAEDRIQEDYLRILRFFRFHAAYGQRRPSEEGLEACQKYSFEIQRLSKERIHIETMKLLGAVNPSQAVELMAQCNIFSYLFSAPIVVKGFDKLVTLTSASLTRLYYLCQHLEVIEVTKRLCLSRQQAQEFISLSRARMDLSHHDSFYALVDRYGKRIAKEAVVCAIAQGKAPEESSLRNLAAIPERAFPVKGQDLLRLGTPPGREIGELLALCHQWWVEKYFEPSKEECLAWIKGQLER